MSIPSGLAGPALGDVVIAKHGDRGCMPLACGGVRVSWEVNQPGEFSAYARLSDALEIESDPANLRGHWLTWEHPDLGHWGGVIQDVATPAGGIVELAARGWLTLLDRRLTRRRDTAIIAHAGPIAARLVKDAGASEPTGLLGTSADEWGDFVNWRDDGGEVLSALAQLSSISDQDYCVGEADRIFYWRRRFGTNKTASVQLVQDAHIATWRASWALAPVITEVVLSPSDPQRFATAPAISGFASDAYAQFGPRQQPDTYRGRLHRSAVRSAATKQAERLSRHGRLIELDVVNHDGCFAWFRKGDTITVVITDIDAALHVRCLLLSWDQDSDVLRISGEITGP